MSALKMKSLFVSRSGRTLAWSIVATTASFFTGIQTARGLGPADRGSLGLALSLAGLGVLVSALGTNVSIRRHLPKKEGVSYNNYKWLSIILIPLVFLLFMVLTYILARYIDETFSIKLFAVCFIFYGLSFYFSNQCLDLLNALGQVSSAARVNACGSLICLVLVFVSGQLNLGLAVIICCYALSVICQAVIALIIAKKHLHEFDQGFSWRGMRILLGDGFRLLGLNVGQTLTYRADTLLLGAMSSTTSVGYYAVATTPASLFRLPVNAIGQVVFFDSAQKIEIKRLLKKLLYIELFLVPPAIIGWLASDIAVTLVFGQNYSPAGAVLRVLIIAELCLAPFLIVSRALAGGGSRLGASVSGLVGVVVLLVLCFALIPNLGALGAAWASVAAYTAMSVSSVTFLIYRSQKAVV